MNPRVRAAYAEFDVDARRLLRKAVAEGLGNIPCRRGCSACCSDVAWVVEPEARELVERVRSMPRALRERVLQGLGRWLEGMVAAGLDPDEKFPDLRTYHRAKLRCPLLSDAGECMVYDIRPLSCRAHYVVAEDASGCANRAEEPEITTAEMPELLTRAMLGILGESAAGDWGGGRVMPKEMLLQRYLGLLLGIGVEGRAEMGRRVENGVEWEAGA